MTFASNVDVFHPYMYNLEESNDNKDFAAYFHNVMFIPFFWRTEINFQYLLYEINPTPLLFYFVRTVQNGQRHTFTRKLAQSYIAPLET